MSVKQENLSHEEVWDDSALIDSWNEALQEYKVGLSILFAVPLLTIGRNITVSTHRAGVFETWVIRSQFIEAQDNSILTWRT